MRKNILLLGASGSIGVQSIHVILAHREQFALIGVSVGRNIAYLESVLDQLVDLKWICVQNKDDATRLASQYPQYTFFYGDQGLIELAEKEADILINALVGFLGLIPTIKAIETKKHIALANKETMVAAGELINDLLIKNQVHLYPVDSEHSAIFQCLNTKTLSEVRRLILTASGGTFRDKSKAEITHVGLQDVLKHPNWSMGTKITIDSATMMNKGLEVIEAHHLFHMPYEKIECVIHPQSIIHSMVEYIDGSIIAQLGKPNMELPIQYALSYPNRLDIQNNYLDLKTMSSLTFKKVDYERFPLVKLAYDCGKKGGNYPIVMNAANEVATELFINGKISFLEIEDKIFDAVTNVRHEKIRDVEHILEIDQSTRQNLKR